ncbi:MAG: ATP-binding protein [Bacteroidetes bacterium]|nr:MAG: ATP-binding protein [Bacteroidota bacterium]
MINTIYISSKIENISIIESLVDQLSREYSLGSVVYGNILVALLEAVTNSIMHGNKMDPEKQVKVTYSLTDEFVEFSISDEGEGFDFENIPDPTRPRNVEKPNGRGVFLMSHLTDELVYNKEKSEIIMRFKI